MFNRLHIRFNSLTFNYCTAKSPDIKIKYSKTVNLPATKFPAYLNANQTIERDARILHQCGFFKLYNWQREHMKGEEYTVHDGPPYANGKPHLGHAINKIFKDIVLRSKLIQGHRVHFVPGWDCHGLPIELKALSGVANSLTPVEIRQKSRKYAIEAASVQKEAFKSFGVLADWDSQCYYTFDKNYVIMQLQAFFELYEKGLLFRDLKPVYWSPSSRTALAESELLYKNDHVSKGVTLKLRVTNSENMYILIWTTTPWTIPANKAVCFSSKINYSVVAVGSEQFVLATNLISEFSDKLKKDVKIIREMSHDELKTLNYKHPFYDINEMKLLESSHVTESGTGFVHTAPSHGQDDFLVGLKYKLSMECLVDENGKYNCNAGSYLSGLDVLTHGNEKVLEKCKELIVHLEDYKHSYPYDWRTEQPVIIRASLQWFINTEDLKEMATESLKGIEAPSDRLLALVKSRPYWCISRQRLWGVPIPSFYHKTTNRPLINKTTIDHICNLIKDKDPDIWWLYPLDQLFPEQAKSELFVSADDIVRGDDVMDIWLDSGLAWDAVLDGRCADLVLEGSDQYTGWFQSSLLTSVALCDGMPPYRKILTHGFAVDESGRKMSKSLGNVIDPIEILQKGFGIDGLRWWVASQAHHPLIPVSDKILQENKESVQRIRLILRFLLGSLNNITNEELVSGETNLNYLDRYLLHVSYSHFQRITSLYNDYQIYKVCQHILNFISDPVSLYLHVVKDRLYCDGIHSEGRKAARMVLNGLLETLTHCLAPIVPHLVEEVFCYRPGYGTQKTFFFESERWQPPFWWQNEDALNVFNVIFELKHRLDALAGPSGALNLSCTLRVNEDLLEILRGFQENTTSTNSQLTELFQVSTVTLEKTNNNLPEDVEIVLEDSPYKKCPRCRRFTSPSSSDLCIRCSEVIKQFS